MNRPEDWRMKYTVMDEVEKLATEDYEYEVAQGNRKEEHLDAYALINKTSQLQLLEWISFAVHKHYQIKEDHESI